MSDPSADLGTRRSPEPSQDAERPLVRLGLPEAAHELLAMVGFLTAPDGPLREVAATGRPSDLHRRVLVKALERADVIANFLRGRISFFMTWRHQDPGSYSVELELAGSTLAASRALALVIDRLLGGALPAEAEFDQLGDAALRIYAALETL